MCLHKTPSGCSLLMNPDRLFLKRSHGEATLRASRALLLCQTHRGLMPPIAPVLLCGGLRPAALRPLRPTTAPTTSPLTGLTVRRSARCPVRPRVAPSSTYPTLVPIFLPVQKGPDHGPVGRLHLPDDHHDQQGLSNNQARGPRGKLDL